MMYVLLFVAAFVAFAVSTVTGGGAGLLLIPAIGLVLPAVEVPAALSIGTAASSVSRIVVFRSAIRWRFVAWFVPAALPSVALGAWLLSRIQPLYLELVIGAFLLCNLAAAVRPQKKPSRRKPDRVGWAAAGAIGGVLSGFTGAIGLVLNGFYLRSGLGKEETVATRAANEVLLHLVKLGLYAGLGLFSRQAVIVGLFVAVGAALAPLGVRRVLTFVAEPAFRRVGQMATCLAGLLMLSSAGASLAAQYGVSVTGHIDRSRIAAKFNWPDGAASLHWLRGHPPEFEQTIDMAALPRHARLRAERLAAGATRVICESVIHWGDRAYEITVVKGGGVFKYTI